jgi:hypothetical protein
MSSSAVDFSHVNSGDEEWFYNPRHWSPVRFPDVSATQLAKESAPTTSDQGQRRRIKAFNKRVRDWLAAVARSGQAGGGSLVHGGHRHPIGGGKPERQIGDAE